MSRTLPRLLGVIVIATLSNTAVKAVAIQKTLHAATSGTPIVIAVLSDHYTDEDEFDNDAANFITYGLLANPYYAAHAGDLQIETFYEPVAAGTTSNYGFNVEVPSQNCAMSWAADTWTKITAVFAGTNNFSPKHTIVIGDHPYNIGCTEGEWTYVGVDAVGSDVLAHELGHGIGQLYDEWVLHADEPHPGLPADPDIARNCHHTRYGQTPPWTFPGSGSIGGCDLYEKEVVHAYDSMTKYGAHSYCLMGATNNAEFCPVCKHFMDVEMLYLENPDSYDPDATNPGIENPDLHNPPPPPPNQPVHSGIRTPVPPRTSSGIRLIRAAFVQPPAKVAPGPPVAQPPKPVVPPPAQPRTITLDPPASAKPRPIVRLVVSFDPVSGDLVAKKAFPITARYVPSHRRTGEYVYEILNGDEILEVGVLSSNLFRSRSYQGGAGHATSPPHATDITIQMPGVTSDMLKDPARNLRIRVWRLMPGVTEKLITPAVFAKLKLGKQAEPRGELTPVQIRNAI